ncbi:hypothetical protein G6F68_009424 [Rhizopus microsporus]|nr:hypothetical protein G6F68_009424 [Rhizopus microsporus]
MELTQDVSILLRVGAAMLFGGVLGVEREMGKHAAGLRTHMLIAGAAALIVGLGDSVAEHFQQERYRDLLQVDPVRLIEAVVACVGFVAAGTILRGSREDQVSGLTTASSLIMAAAIGIAVGIGLVLVNVLKPGAGVDPQVAAMMLSENAERSKEIVAGIHGTPKGMDMLLSIVPSNVLQAASDNGAILSLMFFALMFGIGMVLTDNEKVAPLRRAIEGVFEISMTLINLVIRLAPYAVACFMFNLAALFGFELIIRLGAYVGVVVLALGLHMIVTYGTAVWLSGRSPLSFFRDTQEATVMAFSTASSNATLPTALRVADQMGLPQRVSRFVLTVGATANQNGTALFEGVTVIFLAQFFGVDLSIGQQFMVMAVCILGGIGTAGVPSGSLPVVAMICAMVGVNPLGIGLILGVNHFLDMCRTALNVTGDLALTTLVAKGESHDGPALGPQQD